MLISPVLLYAYIVLIYYYRSFGIFNILYFVFVCIVKHRIDIINTRIFLLQDSIKKTEPVSGDPQRTRFENLEYLYNSFIQGEKKKDLGNGWAEIDEELKSMYVHKFKSEEEELESFIQRAGVMVDDFSVLRSRLNEEGIVRIRDVKTKNAREATYKMDALASVMEYDEIIEYSECEARELLLEMKEQRCNM